MTRLKSSVKGALLMLMALWIFCACGSAILADNDSPGKSEVLYEQDKEWPKLPEDFLLGNVTGLGIDSAQNIVAFHRGGRKWPLLMPMPKTFISLNTILFIDRNSGTLINSWGDSLFIMPHGLTVDANNNIWVTDVGLHQVFKFDHGGTLLMKLGEAFTPGNDHLHFNKPTDVAIAGDGSFYVSDGYGNSRIVHFSSEGKYLHEWGSPGSKPGEFNIPHAITIDKNSNIIVADRENHRIQSFDRNGNFLKEWKQPDAGKVYSITFDQSSGHCAAIDFKNQFIKKSGSDIILIDEKGIVLDKFGRSGFYDGPVCEYHDIVSDNDGNIYVGDIFADTIQKFRKKK